MEEEKKHVQKAIHLIDFGMRQTLLL